MRGTEIRRWLPVDGDFSSFKHSGIVEYEAFYSSPRIAFAPGDQFVTANRLFAIPFLSHNGIADRIALSITILSAGGG